MGSQREKAALVTPISSTSDEDLTPTTTRSPLSNFRNRFSNASLLTLSSVRTLLPQYSAVDFAEPPPSAHSEGSTYNPESPSWNSPASDFPSSGIEPPRYSLLPRSSSILTTTTRFEVESPQDSYRGGFADGETSTYQKILMNRSLAFGEPDPHEFRYSYPIRPKRPWATLYLHTRNVIPGDLKSLQNQPRIPRFWGCDPISGALHLDLDTPQTIQEINVTLSGSIILSAHSDGIIQFLGHEFTLWDKSMGDPPQSDITHSRTTQNKKSAGRLASGQYTFPFSFPFPNNLDVKAKSTGLDTGSILPFPPHVVGTTSSRIAAPTSPLYDQGPKMSEKARIQASELAHSGPLGSERRLGFASQMPQTFMDKDINPNVSYDLSVRIVHGMFKASSRIKTSIAYIPASEPLPASQMRREAYEASGLVACPMDDPEGWFALPAVTIYGVVKINEKIHHSRVNCTLYIAQPLSYPRGSFIPCFIAIYSDDVEVEHLLSSTETPTVRLLRRVRHPVTESETEPSWSTGPTLNTSYAHVIEDMKLVSHEVGSAEWWMPSKDVVQGPNVRHLEGEIHLNPDLQPSCGFQLFNVEYAVELLSFETANFKPETLPGKPSKGNNVVASNPVEITTLYRQDEPVPTPRSEPPKTYRMRSVSNPDPVLFGEGE